MTYTLAATTVDDGGDYDVVVTNVAGNATSTPATLTIQVPPTVTIPPASLTRVLGKSAGFAVTVNGTAPFTYQWRHGGTAIPGATDATYSIATTTVDDGGDYDVVVTNVAGNVTSTPATLTIKVPPTITEPSVCAMVLGATISAARKYRSCFRGNRLAHATPVRRAIELLHGADLDGDLFSPLRQPAERLRANERVVGVRPHNRRRGCLGVLLIELEDGGDLTRA